MPNLYHSDLAQNTRRVRTGDSNLGTRRIQFYEISVNGLTTEFINSLEGLPSRPIDQEGGFLGLGIDQGNTYEYTSPTIIEAMIRGIQSMSEIYIVGYWDYYQYDPNYWDLVVTVGVSADTVESGWEQYVRGEQGHSDTIYHAVDRAVNDFDPPGGYDGVTVQPVQLVGSGTYDMGQPPFALKEAQTQVYRARRAARLASLSTPPQSRRNPG